ncbi:glucuronoxylan 4-O-methyltransferase 1 [Punica granatum]|uniref:Uncharacterized protein n=2 Tax=Punica granatum TaxID=22663 RepID=A0A2I0IH72_PUNGR|nr:glucuronoxylan 4-O-methyltransferase 1 [Punica granatum]PKI43361.1 hypothetical protein CRG98_036257 [Punica granatum]
MPPEAPQYSPQVTPLIRHSPPTSSSEAELRQPATHRNHTRGYRKMKFNARKLIPALVLILACLSIIRLLRIAINTSSPTLPPACSTSPLACTVFLANITQNKISPLPASTAALTAKEFQFLSNIVKHRAPCNLLIFGLEPEYLILSSINAGGTTTILEDDSIKLSAISPDSKSTRIHKVKYRTPAKHAYKLLKHARKNPACGPSHRPLQSFECQLALTGLPREVYETNWDLIVVDGPRGNAPEVPGRMASIYTAGVIARNWNSTDVLVHDVDRTIEKWFSWEFLCEENLTASKGNFWNFRIRGQSNSTRFCSPREVVIY